MTAHPNLKSDDGDVNKSVDHISNNPPRIIGLTILTVGNPPCGGAQCRVWLKLGTFGNPPARGVSHD